MTALEIPMAVPRAPDAVVLSKSLVRPNASRYIFAAEVVFCAYHVILNLTDLDFLGLVGFGIGLAIWAVLTAWIWSHPRRLTEVWRDGTMTDVRIAKAYYVAFRLSMCRVELDRRHAWVLVKGEYTPGQRLPALHHGDWIAAIDPSGLLRLGRVS